ncbi:MAG: GC-type dockerin domain-anchored protein [Phycisphaerales bacterium]
MKSVIQLFTVSGMALACAGAVSTAHASSDAQPAVDGSGLGGSGLGGSSHMEVLESSHRQIAIPVDSGPVSGASVAGGVSSQDVRGADAIQEAVWSTIVRVDDAAWLRIEFDDVDLSSATEGSRESYLRVTSLFDGYEQYLDFDALQKWGNTTAYFNGSAVKVEIMASPGSTTNDRVQISGVQASASVNPASICGTVDDRTLSDDPRDGRLMPIACSAWLFGEQGSSFLSAAHCGPGAGDVMQFNVPLSTSNGVRQNPPPQDQYVVDGSSAQTSDGIFLGNDWGFFGVFDNTDTGLSPLDAQGDSYTLTPSPIPNDGRPIRITGYGSTSSPVNPRWNGVQKTHVGPFQGYSGNVVRYTTDTTGGNSGSAILDDTTNMAIGIHTNAGCGTGGGWNNGCNLFNVDLQTALANPLGMTVPRSIQAIPSPVPAFVSPAGGETLQLVISNFQGREIVGVPTLWLDTGSGFVSSPTTMVNSNTYEAILPAIDCETAIAYYFELNDNQGETTTYPNAGAQGALATIALDSLEVAHEDNFQTDMGWIEAENSGVTSGEWARIVPHTTTGNGGPTADADGSGRAYVTGRVINEDVDGGAVTLTSQLFDASVVLDPTFSFQAWVNTQDDETLQVEFSSTFGLTWVPVDQIQDTQGWVKMNYRISEYVTPNQIFQVRFIISDDGADSLVEAGVDDMSIASMICNTNECAADFTGEGDLNFADISAFLAAFGAQDASADLVSDGSFNFLDVSEFLNLFGAGCP